MLPISSRWLLRTTGLITISPSSFLLLLIAAFHRQVHFVQFVFVALTSGSPDIFNCIEGFRSVTLPNFSAANEILTCNLKPVETLSSRARLIHGTLKKCSDWQCRTASALNRFPRLLIYNIFGGGLVTRSCPVTTWHSIKAHVRRVVFCWRLVTDRGPIAFTDEPVRETRNRLSHFQENCKIRPWKTRLLTEFVSSGHSRPAIKHDGSVCFSGHEPLPSHGNGTI